MMQGALHKICIKICASKHALGDKVMSLLAVYLMPTAAKIEMWMIHGSVGSSSHGFPS